MTAHWIDVNAQTEAWTLRAEVVGFRLLHGTHAGKNLGCYFVGLCDRVGIMSPEYSKVCFHLPSPILPFQFGRSSQQSHWTMPPQITYYATQLSPNMTAASYRPGQPCKISYHVSNT